MSLELKSTDLWYLTWISMVLQLSSLHLELRGLVTQLYDGKMEKEWRPECLTTTDLHILVQYEDARTIIIWIQD